MMVITNPANYFYLNNGEVLKDLNDLLEAMKKIDSNTFFHHLNDEKNDFYNWTKDILKDGFLANRIKSSKTPAEVVGAIEKRILSISHISQRRESKKSRINQIKEAHYNG